MRMLLAGRVLSMAPQGSPLWTSKRSSMGLQRESITWPCHHWRGAGYEQPCKPDPRQPPTANSATCRRKWQLPCLCHCLLYPLPLLLLLSILALLGIRVL
jgi:hypothetical protein